MVEKKHTSDNCEIEQLVVRIKEFKAPLSHLGIKLFGLVEDSFGHCEVDQAHAISENSDAKGGRP